MNRADSANATPAMQALQLKIVCIWAGIAALGPMLRYYYFHFRVVGWPIEVSGFPAGRDFVNLWSGGRAALSGDYAMLFDAKKYAADLQHVIHSSIIENGLVWSYPPTAFWLGLPFAGLPFYAALPLWMLLGLGAAFWAYRVGGITPMPLWPLPFLVLAPGILMVLFFGQTALVTSALFIGGLVLAKDRPIAAGALLAGFVVKPHMGLAIPVLLLAMRHWRAFAATAGFSIVYVVVTVLAFGLEPWDLYLNVTLPKHLGLLTPWGKLLPWMFTAQYFQFIASGLSPEAAMRLHWLVAAAALAAVAWSLPRLRDLNLQLTVAAAVTLLISPYMQSYELALPAIAALRAAAYAPPADKDPHVHARMFIVLLGLMSPVIGLLVTDQTGINPVSALMLAIVGAAVLAVWPSKLERQAWGAPAIRSWVFGAQVSKPQI